MLVLSHDGSHGYTANVSAGSGERPGPGQPQTDYQILLQRVSSAFLFRPMACGSLLTTRRPRIASLTPHEQNHELDRFARRGLRIGVHP